MRQIGSGAGDDNTTVSFELAWLWRNEMYVRVFGEAGANAERGYFKTIDWKIAMFWAEGREATG